MDKTNGHAMNDSPLSALFNPAALKAMSDMSDAAKREEQATRREEKLLEVIDEMKQTLADLVAHIEGSDSKAVAKTMVEQLTAAIKAMPAPQVKMEPKFEVHAPNVQLDAVLPSSGAEREPCDYALKDVKYDREGRITGLRLAAVRG